jgi:hypothetical protein
VLPLLPREASVYLDYEQIARAILEEAKAVEAGLGAHFKQDRDAIEQERERAPENFRARVRWLSIGEAVELPSGGAG